MDIISIRIPYCKQLPLVLEFPTTNSYHVYHNNFLLQTATTSTVPHYKQADDMMTNSYHFYQASLLQTDTISITIPYHK
jgi:hypothetical protein